MLASIIVFFISCGLLSLYLILTYTYHRHLQKVQEVEELDKKEKSLDILLAKYAVKEKKDVMKDKLTQISQIVAETERDIAVKAAERTKVAEESFKEKESEVEIVQQANMTYRTFSQGLKAAMPTTEDERQKDLVDLKDTISALESLDEEEYLKGKKTIDIGRGMFLDKMSQQVDVLIKELKLNEKSIIPVNRLIYHSIKNVKRIQNEDFEPIFDIMKETGFLKDFIEINPELSLIVFKEKQLRFNTSEKVLLAFAYSEDYLTPEKLMELTEWGKGLADKTIKSLERKGLLSIYDNNIKIEGFGSSDERREWDSFIKKFVVKEKKDIEDKRKRQEEREKDFQEKMVLKQKEKEKKAAEKIEKMEPYEGVDGITAPPKGEPQRIKDMDNMIGAMDKLGEIETRDLKSAAQAAEPQEVDEEIIPEKILEYYENNLILTGGLFQAKKITDYVREQVKGAGMKAILDTFKKLEEMQMIHGSFLLERSRVYLFQEIDLDDKDKEFLTFALNKDPMKKEEFLEGLKWEEEDLLKVLKKFQELNILRIESNKLIIPGIIQKS